MNPWLITLPLAYLLGSIPFGYLLVRLFRKQDIRDTGSGNTGATNVAREARGLGILTLVLDLAKAWVAIVLTMAVIKHARTFHLSYAVNPSRYFDFEVASAVAVVVGHIYPVWLALRGGKGVACALGVFLVLVPRAALCILGVFLIVFLLTRFVSLASMVAAASFPLFAFFFISHPSPLVVAGFLFIPALIIWKHRANIGRLLAHSEPRMGQKKVAA